MVPSWVSSWCFQQMLGYTAKWLPGTNTPAYLASSSATKTKSFKTATPGLKIPPRRRIISWSSILIFGDRRSWNPGNRWPQKIGSGGKIWRTFWPRPSITCACLKWKLKLTNKTGFFCNESYFIIFFYNYYLACWSFLVPLENILNNFYDDMIVFRLLLPKPHKVG